MKIEMLFIVLLSLAIISCNKVSHQDHHADEEEVKLKITAYSNEFELFAEADPFSVGKTSEILSHFSHQPSFKALENGKITMRLITGDKEISTTLDKPTRKGIYKFEIKPETAGPSKIIFDFYVENEKYKLIVEGITVFKDDKIAFKEASEIIIPQTNTVVFTKEQSWKTDFATAYPVIMPFGPIIKTVALIEPAQGDEEIVVAKSSGVVFFKADNLLEGKTVNAGQSLCHISGNGMIDNNISVKFAEAKINFEKSKSDYERAKELSKDKIVSEKELNAVKKDFENAKAVYENYSKNSSYTGQNVISPFSGNIKQIFVKNGQFIEAGQPLFIVSQNKTLLLKANISQKYASKLYKVNNATIYSATDNQSYTIEQLNGKILAIGKSANSDNYLIPVNIQIDNIGNFLPGSFVDLYLKSTTNANALTVPNTALLEEQGNFYVYVQINPELFEKREIQIGVSDGMNTEIIKGLEKSERIVTVGAIMVKLAQASGALDAHSGHVH